MMKKQILAVLQPNFGGKNSFDLIDQKSDENEQIIITEAKMNDNYFIVISICNSNKGFEQSKTFSILQNMLDDTLYLINK